MKTKPLLYIFFIRLVQFARPPVRLEPSFGVPSFLGGLIFMAANFILGVIAVLSFISLIFSIIMFMIASGDEERQGMAGSFFAYFFVGTAVVFLAVALENYLRHYVV